MDRFTETLPSLTSHLRAIYGDFEDSPIQEVYTCENCRREVTRITHVPEFDYLGCDRCYAEAIEVLSQEEAERLKRKPLVMASQLKAREVALDAAAGLTLEQHAAWNSQFASKEVA